MKLYNLTKKLDMDGPMNGTNELRINAEKSFSSVVLCEHGSFRPNFDDPLILGPELVILLNEWANSYGFNPETILYWQEDIGISKLYPYQNDALWQISWVDGPDNWAILLAGSNSLNSRSETLTHQGASCYFEPADTNILGCIWSGAVSVNNNLQEALIELSEYNFRREVEKSSKSRWCSALSFLIISTACSLVYVYVKNY